MYRDIHFFFDGIRDVYPRTLFLAADCDAAMNKYWQLWFRTLRRCRIYSQSWSSEAEAFGWFGPSIRLIGFLYPLIQRKMKLGAGEFLLVLILGVGSGRGDCDCRHLSELSDQVSELRSTLQIHAEWFRQQRSREEETIGRSTGRHFRNSGNGQDPEKILENPEGSPFPPGIISVDLIEFGIICEKETLVEEQVPPGGRTSFWSRWSCCWPISTPMWPDCGRAGSRSWRCGWAASKQKWSSGRKRGIRQTRHPAGRAVKAPPCGKCKSPSTTSRIRRSWPRKPWTYSATSYWLGTETVLQLSPTILS